MQRLYLFTLEVDPLTLGGSYNPLPSHLTLVSRFWSELSPDVIANAATLIFEHTKPIELIFGEEAIIGPKKTAVHLIENADVTKSLHYQLVELLNSLNVIYTLPQFVGEGHLPHISKREGTQFVAGSCREVGVAYLIEVEIHGENHLRHVRAEFSLGD